MTLVAFLRSLPLLTTRALTIITGLFQARSFCIEHASATSSWYVDFWQQVRTHWIFGSLLYVVLEWVCALYKVNLKFGFRSIPYINFSWINDLFKGRSNNWDFLVYLIRCEHLKISFFLYFQRLQVFLLDEFKMWPWMNIWGDPNFSTKNDDTFFPTFWTSF